MSLRLNVPELEEKPSVPADTRPKYIQQVISTLPMANSRAAAQVLLHEIERINRQRISTDSRLTALELYRPAILHAVHGLSRQYCNQTLPLQETAMAQAELSQELLTELAYGYKQAILSEEDRLFSFGDDNQLAVLLHRAIDTLGRLLTVFYQTYAPAPVGIWAEIHLLYLHTLQLSIQNLSVPDDLMESSANLAYKRALLLSLADPSHLTSIDIDRVIDYLVRFADLAQLHPLGTPDKTEGLFLVHLNSDTPPVPLAKNTQNADQRTDILLITVELARQVHQHLGQLQSNEPIHDLNLPEEAAIDQRYRDMLIHLLKHWGNPPQRLFKRSEKISPVSMCVGLSEIHSFIGQESSPAAITTKSEEADVTLNFANSPIDTGGSAVYKSAKWMVKNESPGGLALTKSSASQDALRIGELLGLKLERDSHWGLAAVRWATTGPSLPLQIGAQMIAPSAKTVTIRVPEHSQPEAALLLPELPTLKQPTTLITARGVYKPARTIQLEEDGQKIDILLTRLVERTNSFERFQFSRI